LVGGIGEGTMLTLLFNVLVSASPKRLAGDVGALRGVVNNVSNALGAALASVVAVGLLGIFLASAFSRSELPPELHAQVLSGAVEPWCDLGDAGAGERGGRDQRRQPGPRVAGVVLDRRSHFVVVDLPSREIAEVRAG